MALDDVYLVSKRLNVVRSTEVKQLEQTNDIQLPEGYAEFMAKFGEGIYSGFVRVYPPPKVIKERKIFAAYCRRYFLWKPTKLVSREDIASSIPVGDSLQGDQLIYHPSKEILYVLPRHSERIMTAGKSLIAAIDWMCESGKLTSRIEFKYFEPLKNRKKILLKGKGDFAEVQENLEGLGVHFHSQLSREDGRFVQLFVPKIGGSISLFGLRKEIECIIFCDDECKSPVLKRIVSCLNVVGLRGK